MPNKYQVDRDTEKPDGNETDKGNPIERNKGIKYFFIKKEGSYPSNLDQLSTVKNLLL